MSLENDATESMKLALYIKPMLAGKGAHVQGAVLAELMALLLAGHHPSVRESVLTLWLATVRELVPVCENEIFGGPHRPEGWT
jgi:hypothetical protein